LGFPSPIRELATQWFDARKTNSKPTTTDKYRWDRHLAPLFEKCKAADVSPRLTRQFIKHRKTEKNRFDEAPGSGTINRELSIPRAAFGLAMKDERLRHVPHFPMLTEENVREGFLRDEDYGKLADGAAKVGLRLRTLLAVYYNFEWRRAEAADRLKVSQVDVASRTILLRVGAGKIKSRNGRDNHAPGWIACWGFSEKPAAAWLRRKNHQGN
jgi:hypothetical protein